jgi:hypothetical protein
MRRRTTGAATLTLICAVVAAGLSALVLRRLFQESPPADFADLYLLGVLALAYRYAWKFAAILAAASLVFSAYVLAPLDGRDWFQLASYAVCSGLIIWIMASLRQPPDRTRPL